MDIKEVQGFIESNKDNKDVQSYVKGFITSDRVNEYLDTKDGEKLLQPRLDSFFTKSNETWKTNNLDKIVNDKVDAIVLEKYPTDTPEQKAFKKLSLDFEAEKKSRIKSELKAIALETATKKGLPPQLAGYFIGDSEESTKTNLTLFEEAWTAEKSAAVQKVFADNGRVISNNINKQEGLLSKADVENTTREFRKANKDLIARSQESW